MRGLDLFSGIGGLTYALEPWIEPVAYCENDRYAQAVLLSRMADGRLPRAPIWDDVRTLRSENLPNVDIIVGGFPCQDVSQAGARQGLDGERTGLYREVLRLIDECEPAFAFLENVRGISRAIPTITADLAERGFVVRVGALAAADIGAPHIRERVWFFAANPDRLNVWEQPGGGEWSSWISSVLPGITRSARRNIPVGDANRERQLQQEGFVKSRGRRNRDASCALANSDGERQGPFDASWWRTEPDVGGTSNGLPGSLDGSGGLGNAETEEAYTREILQYLSSETRAQTLQWATRRISKFQAEEFLFAVVREYEKGGRLSRRFVESEASPEAILRAMQDDRTTSSTSCRRGSFEQLFREYPDALRELSRMVASRGETPWSNPLWESSVPRAEIGIPFRMDRLRGLGNAVVPAQARRAFEILSGLNQ